MDECQKGDKKIQNPNKNDKDSKKRNLSSDSKTTPHPRRQRRDENKNSKNQATIDKFTVNNKEDDLSSESDGEYAKYLSGT